MKIPQPQLEHLISNGYLVEDYAMREMVSNTIKENWPKSAKIEAKEVAAAMVNNGYISGTTRKVEVNGMTYWTDDASLYQEYQEWKRGQE